MAEGGNKTLGLALAAGAAAAYSLSAVMAGISYQHGNEPASLVAARFFFASLVILPLALITRRSLALPASSLMLLAGMVLGSIGTAIGYMSSIRYIPVSLAVLIFYLFPLLVTLSESLLQRRAPSLWLLLAVALGFLGLSLALGPDFATLDTVGIGFALLAAFSCIPLFICGRILVLKHDTLSLAVHINFAAFALVMLLLLGNSSLVIPASPWGWGSLALACLCFAAGFLMQLSAVRRALPGPAAMMFNTEPLLTVFIAWLFLGQSLSAWQWLGAGLVLGALLLLVGRKG